MKAGKSKEKVVLYENGLTIQCDVKEKNTSHIVSPLHYHSDYQLIVVRDGDIKILIDSCPISITAGDIILIGSNVLHGIYKKMEDLVNISGAIVFFNNSIFPLRYKLMPEFRSIYQLLEESKMVVKTNNKTIAAKFYRYISSMRNEQGIKKITTLYALLEQFEKIEVKNTLISSKINSNIILSPVNKALHFIYNHYKTDISISDIAQVSGITVSALCRAFKSSCDITVFEFLNKVRIEKVCNLLFSSDCTISEAAFNCGFRSLSNFNRQFKKIKGISPTEYLISLSK